MTSTDAYLRDRYGSDTGKNRILWLGGAIAALIIGGWIIWQAVTLSQPQAHGDFLGMTTNSNSSVTVRYNVTSDVGQKVRCTVHAFNEHSIEVGVAEIETLITRQPTTVETELVTTQEAARADVEDCTVVK